MQQRTMSIMLTRAILAGMLALAPAAAVAQAADPAAVRVEAYGHAVAGAARAGASESVPARAERFLTVVRSYYDLTGALALIAGPAWASATPAERTAAIDAFARNGAIQHSENFHGAGFALTVDAKTATRQADRLVRSHIGGETLIYRLRESGAQWRILDVQARGVSQLAVQKADFAGTVAKGGVAGLTAKLNEINARPR